MPPKLDRLRNRFIGQGIVPSGVASRAIQQADIEENRSLRANIAESRATLRNQARQRQSKFASKAMKSRVNLGSLRRGGGRGEVSGAIPVSVRKLGDKFSLQAESGAGLQGRTFETLPELERFLKQNPEFAQNLITTASLKEEQPGLIAQQNIVRGLDAATARRLGARFVTPGEARQAFGIPQFGFGSFKGVPTPKAVGARPTDSIAVIKQGLIPTRGEKRRAIDIILNNLISRIASGGASSNDKLRLDIFKRQLSLGKGFAEVQRLIKEEVF